MRPLVMLALAVALLTGCNSSSPTATPTPTATGTPDAFSALAPPRTPGVGNLDPAFAQRAYDATQGLLALQLLEAGTLNGTGRAELAAALLVPEPTLSVTRFIASPTRRGLDIRPLFPTAVTLGTPIAEVVRSSYTADEVQGTGGEVGIRIGWDGEVRYAVTVAGQPHTVTYALKIAYIFGPVAEEPLGLRLMQVVPGTSQATPVVTACLAKGLLLPTSPSTTTRACPV